VGLRSELVSVTAGVTMLMSVAAGCAGSQEPGSASPAGSNVGGATTTQPTAQTGRPASLPLDDVRPCDLFTDAVRQQFELGGTPTSGADGRGQPDCQMRSAASGGFIVSAATGEGMARFDNIPEQLAKVRAITVGGFPAAELRDVHQPFACLIGIDVADGQHLGVYVSDAPKGGTQDEICQTAARFAEAVLASLRQQLGR
jgi:Protein of unknown function (DUF3558)